MPEGAGAPALTLRLPLALQHLALRLRQPAVGLHQAALEPLQTALRKGLCWPALGLRRAGLRLPRLVGQQGDSKEQKA